MDIYLPGLPGLARDFDVGASSAQVTMTTYLIGMALGQLVAGSLSDVYGRRGPLITGMAVFGFASLVCALAPSLYALAAVRLVQGAAAAAGVAIGRAVVRDLYSGAAAARYLSRLLLIVGLGPILAPIVGGQILRFTSWRGVFVTLALLGLALAILAAWLLPETLARESRRTPGMRATGRTFRFLLADRRFVCFVLIIGLAAGAIFGYIAGSSFVLEDVYGASPQLYGVLFGVNAVCLVIGAQINAHLLKRRSPHVAARFRAAHDARRRWRASRGCAVPRGRPCRSAPAARPPHVQLELCQFQWRRARLDRSSGLRRNSGGVARGQPVRVRSSAGAARGYRRQ